MKNNINRKRKKYLPVAGFIIVLAIILGACQSIQVNSVSTTTATPTSLVYYLPSTGYQVTGTLTVQHKKRYLISETIDSTVQLPAKGKSERTNAIVVKKDIQLVEDVIIQCDFSDSIKVTPVLYADLSQKYELQLSDQKGLSRSTFQITYASNNLPIIQTFNATKESHAPQVIAAAIKTVVAGVNLAANIAAQTAKLNSGLEGLMGMPGTTHNVADPQKPKSAMAEGHSKWTYQRDSIVITEEKVPVSVFFSPADLNVVAPACASHSPLVLTGTSTAVVPTINARLNRVPPAAAGPSTMGSNPVAGLVYRTPGIGKLEVWIMKGTDRKNLVCQSVQVPQFGDLGVAPIKIKGGKYNTTIEFNTTNGGLYKYSVEKESVVAAALDSTSGALNNAGTTVEELKVKRLKNENERLKLLLEQKALRDSLNK